MLVHLLPTTNIRLTEVLDAARKGAIATESRFLRVLDAVECDDPELPIGGYVVCEYTPGQNLEELLQNGPLTPTEAAWIVREVADAMTSMHAQGLFHERLSPDTVLITASGNVKIVGFGVEAVLEPTNGEKGSWTQRELTDVRALGKLLYAALVYRWPGGDAWGMRAAPRDTDGQYLTPRQVRQGVSPVLDSICDRILSELPRDGEPPLESASDIVFALNRVLGMTDASTDLENRLRYPTVRGERPAEAQAADATAELPQVATAETDEPDLPPVPLTIQPPPIAVSAAPLAKPRRRWLTILVSVVCATLLISLAVIAVQNATRGAAQPSQGITPDTPPVGRAITAGKDFDPFGGDGENPKLVPLAFDGKNETAWTTERYRKSADFGGLKPGVGVILDLGEPKLVRVVRVNLGGQPTSLEVRVIGGDAPGEALDDWQVVGSASDLGETADISVQPTTTRYVLVWLTKVPANADRFQGRINEVQVLG